VSAGALESDTHLPHAARHCNNSLQDTATIRGVSHLNDDAHRSDPCAIYTALRPGSNTHLHTAKHCNALMQHAATIRSVPHSSDTCAICMALLFGNNASIHPAHNNYDHSDNNDYCTAADKTADNATDIDGRSTAANKRDHPAAADLFFSAAATHCTTVHYTTPHDNSANLTTAGNHAHSAATAVAEACVTSGVPRGGSRGDGGGSGCDLDSCGASGISRDESVECGGCGCGGSDGKVKFRKSQLYSDCA